MDGQRSLADWLRVLPFRRFVGGLLLGTVWTLVSGTLQGSFHAPPGGLIAAVLRVVVAIILPLGVLGLIWGISERIKLSRSVNQGGRELEETLGRTMPRQVGKAVLCGVAFGICVGGVFPGQDSRSWDTLDHLGAHLSNALDHALLAIPVGLAVGFFFKRNLARRLGSAHAASAADAAL